MVFDVLIEMIFLLGSYISPSFLINICYFVFSDIFFNFHITFVNSKGEVVFDRRQIACNYLKGRIVSQHITWFT